MPGTVTLHRVIKAPPIKVYRAFGEPDALCKWIPPDGFTCTIQEFDFRVGGRFGMSFRNFTTGDSHSFGGEYRELVEGRFLRYSDVFDDPGLEGEMETTVTLAECPMGCDLNIVQAGIPDPIPVSACYLGWQESLRNLALLVEPDITM